LEKKYKGKEEKGEEEKILSPKSIRVGKGDKSSDKRSIDLIWI